MRQIEHLERKHKENPEGLTFAPLANAYRSSGQPERAIETLMEGLQHHPDHAPARIVLGRCHLDLEDNAAAETAFAQVFDLDRENVVALKALADICEQASRYDDAARWLGHLLEADRDNREAREQLERVSYTKEIAPEGGAQVDAVSHEAVQDVIKADDAQLDQDEEDEVEDAEAPEAEEVGALGAAAVEVEPLVIDTPWGEAPSVAENAVDEEFSEDESTEDEVSAWEPPAIASDVTEGESVSGLEGPGGPAEDEPAAETANWMPAEPLVDEDIDEANDFHITEPPEDVSLQARAEKEFLVENAGEDLELTASENNEFQQSSDAELLQPSVEEDAGEGSISLSWFSPASDEPAESVVPESGPDGTAEPLETAFGTEPDTPVETPFEESEPLPSPWGPAGEVEEEIRAVSEIDATADEEGGIEVEPGSLLEDETAEDSELPEDDVYQEVLGSDKDEAPPVEVEPIAGAEPEPEPAFVATETMAEVYLSQGHRLEALDVYRVLLRSTPDDARLSEKVSALEKELDSGVGGEAVVVADGAVVEPGVSYAASATGGKTVKALFHDLLATRPAETASPEVSAAPEARDLADSGQGVVGEPTRPAQDPLSLSAIFGEDSSPVPPALGRGSDKAEGEVEGGFSFDNFFGDEKGDSGSKRPSGSPPKGREKEEDLDQFQSWLQGLKG